MDERNIEEIIYEELSSGDQEIALDFVRHLHKMKLDFVRDRGYWKNKIYYLIKLDDQCVCFIAIKDPDEKDNRWTVWSDDMDSSFLEKYPLEKSLRETAWEHVDLCGACGSCGGGRHKTIFGKTFEKVCGCTFRFDNPDAEDLLFMKKMVDIRIDELTTLAAFTNK